MRELPGAQNTLVLGILSIVLTLCCCGPFGIVFSILGLVSAQKAQRLYDLDSEAYTGYENVKTGRILSYIGLGLSLVYLILTILYFGAIVAFILASNA